MKPTEVKYKLAEQYKDILKVINLFGDGAILQDQLQQILMLTGRYSRKASIVDALKKLEEYEIIKKVNAPNYRSQFILFRKFAIQYVKGKENSQQVSALKQFSNEKYEKIVFKTQLFITRFLKETRSLDDVLKIVEDTQCSILYNQEQAYEYVNSHAHKHQQNVEYQRQVKLLKGAREQSNAILNQSEKGIKPNEGEIALLYQLFRKGIIILQVKENGVIYGHTGSLNIKTIATAYKLAEIVTRDVFKRRATLVHVLTPIEGTAISINHTIQQRNHNPRTKELAKYTKLQQELIKQGMSTAIAEGIREKQIKATAIDISKYRTSDR